MLQSMKRVGHDLATEQQQPSASGPGRELQRGKGLETEFITLCPSHLSYRLGNINSN